MTQEPNSNPDEESTTNSDATGTEQLRLDGGTATHPLVAEVQELIDADAPLDDVITTVFEDAPHDESLTLSGITLMDYARLGVALSQMRDVLLQAVIESRMEGRDPSDYEHLRTELERYQDLYGKLDEERPAASRDLLTIVADAIDDELGDDAPTGGLGIFSPHRRDDDGEDEEPRGYA